jgi:hypothetical protein
VLFPDVGWHRSADFTAPSWVATLGESPVEFIAIPPGANAEGRPGGNDHGWSNGRPAPTRGGGAGLEIDLGDPKRTAGLPDDLKAALPQVGLVNYPEAQALVEALEQLVQSPCFRSACAAGPQGVVPVAVLALYPAQVRLLRLLADRSPVLAENQGQFEVGLPSDFLHRECLIGLVSLTRSHTHRAVPFCDNPRTLVQALTRSIARVVVFGDPGTVFRRLQWPGALDHLDEGPARREQALLGHLVSHLPERLPELASPKTRLTESSSV